MAAPREIDVLFLSAARTGDVSMLQRLSEKYENGEGPGKVRYTRLRSPDGYNALYLAAQAGKIPACRFLIRSLKFDVNEAAAACVANGNTALFLSIENKHRPTTIFLLENGADITKRNIFGIPNPTISHYEMTPLFAPLKAKSMECVKLLLEAGADSSLHCYMTTPLKWAACQLDAEFVKILLEAGADPNTPDSVGNKPIESAAFVYRSETVKLLFPVTSPIPKYPHWSASEVIKYQATMEAAIQAAFNT